MQQAPMNMFYNADCVEGMKWYPDGYFDLAVVDPPFGIGPTWSKTPTDRFYHAGKNYDYQNERAPGRPYFRELMRVSKHQVIWGANYFTRFLPPTNAWLIWDKDRNADRTFMSQAELAWTSFKTVTRILRYRWDGAKKCEPCDKIHPHQKPVALYRWIFERFANAGDRILDTHVGSGSSLIACKQRGLEYVGFEIDPDYFAAASRRLDNYREQLKLDYEEVTE